MAASGYLSMNSQRSSSGFMTLLSSAVCEWFLMLLIYIYAAFSYLLTKFSCYCDLQPPCLLCSRLDHVFGEGTGHYRVLLCSNHREEISSTVYCHIHDKLADVREMCEECFMSIAMQNKRSSELYKIMVGKLGMDFEHCGFQSPYSKKNVVSPYPGARACLCCNKPLKTKTNAQRLLQMTPAGLGASRANVRPPLPRVPGRSRLSHRDTMKRIRDKISGSVTSPRSRTTAEKIMTYAGYSELKFNSNSDSESEVPFSDDDDGSSTFHEKFDPSESFLSQLGSDNLAEKVKPSPSTPPELSLLNGVPSSSNIVKGPLSVAAERLKSDVPLSQLSSIHGPSDHVLLKVVPPKSNAAEIPWEVPPEQGSTVNSTQADFSNETASSNDTDLSEVSKTIVTNKGREVSGQLAAQDANSDSVEVDKTENLEPPGSDASSSEGNRVNKSFASLDKHDSGYESVDMSSVNEIEGEDIVDRLKRQIDYDKKCLSSLHKELEEERNASEISTNQAMAMITKLQEEKSELRMESLQYLRMMEEQAEYDEDALIKANDLLAEKEFHIQELETELEFYRNYLDESTLGNLPDETSKHLRAENKKNSNNDVACIDADSNVPSDSRSTKLYEGGEQSTFDRSCFLELVDEKKYITQCLKDLERKLHQVCTHVASSGTPSAACSANITDEKESIERNCTDREAKTDDQNEKNGVSSQEDASISNDNPSTHDGNSHLVEDKHFNSEESHSDQQKTLEHGGKIDLGTLENEISDLNDRLEALEVDQDILEHSVNTLRGGKEGFQFLKEIAKRLQELRKAEFGGR